MGEPVTYLRSAFLRSMSILNFSWRKHLSSASKFFSRSSNLLKSWSLLYTILEVTFIHSIHLTVPRLFFRVAFTCQNISFKLSRIKRFGSGNDCSYLMWSAWRSLRSRSVSSDSSIVMVHSGSMVRSEVSVDICFWLKDGVGVGVCCCTNHATKT